MEDVFTLAKPTICVIRNMGGQGKKDLFLRMFSFSWRHSTEGLKLKCKTKKGTWPVMQNPAGHLPVGLQSLAYNVMAKKTSHFSRRNAWQFSSDTSINQCIDFSCKKKKMTRKELGNTSGKGLVLYPLLYTHPWTPVKQLPMINFPKNSMDLQKSIHPWLPCRSLAQ